MSNSPFRVTLIEDNLGDIALIEQSFRELGAHCEITTLQDGAAARKALDSYKSIAKHTLPNIILLDLNLPKMHGLDVLSLYKSIPSVSHIPIIVMTSSSDQADITEAYDRGANSFVTKPRDFDEVTKLVRSIKDFWIDTVQLPGLVR